MKTLATRASSPRPSDYPRVQLLIARLRFPVLFLSAFEPDIVSTFKFWAPSFLQITFSRFHKIIPRVHDANCVNEKNLAKQVYKNIHIGIFNCKKLAGLAYIL